jgi:hypothetical protein
MDYLDWLTINMQPESSLRNIESILILKHLSKLMLAPVGEQQKNRKHSQGTASALLPGI